MVKRFKTLGLVGLMLVASGLVFGAFAQISGTVSSGGEPVEGVFVKIVSAEENGTFADSMVTDENGSFGFDDLDEGSYIITFEKEGYKPLQTTANISDDGVAMLPLGITLEEEELPPPPTFSISGVVSDDEGNEPLEGAKVKLIDNEGEAIDSLMTAEDGEYVFDDLIDGAYKIIVSLEGYITDTTDVVVDDDDVEDKDISLVRIEVTPPPVPVVTVTVGGDIVYGESVVVTPNCVDCGDEYEITLVFVGALSRENAAEDADSTYGPISTVPTLPGNYTVFAQLLDDDDEVLAYDSAKFAIRRKPLVWTEGKVFDKLYDGTPAAVVDSNGIPVITGFLAGDSIAVSYGATGTVAFADSSAGNGIAIIAGGWSAALSPADIAWKYMTPAQADSISNQPTFAAAAIGKATVTGVSQEILVKAEREHDYDFNLRALLPTLTAPRVFGGVTYEIKDVADDASIFEEDPDIDADTTLVFTVSEEAAADDSAKITITVKSANYDDFDVVITVKATGKYPVTISAVMTGGVYSGEPFAFDSLKITDEINDRLIDNDSIKVVVLYESVGSEEYSDSLAPVNAGSYKLTLSVEDDDYAGIAVFEFEIERKTVTIKANNIEVDSGAVAPELTYSVTGLIGNDTLLTKPTIECEDLDMDKPGLYPIVISGATVDSNYTIVRENGTLTVKGKTVGIVADAREVVGVGVDEVAVVSPVKITASEVSAGPNPVNRTGAGAVNFFRVGRKIESGSLTVYSASGTVVAKIGIRDMSDNNAARQIASWDLKDTRGRTVSEGTYLVRGTVKTVDGKREKVSIMVGVR